MDPLLQVQPRHRPVLVRTLFRPPNVEHMHNEFLRNTAITATLTCVSFSALFLVAAWRRFTNFLVF